MDITITGRHVNVTDAMRAHARERVERISDNFGRLTRLEATLDIDGINHVVELIGTVRRGGPLVVHGRTRDMYSAIDMAADKLERRLRKEKEKVKDHRARRAVEGLAAAETETPEAEPEEEEIV